MIELQSFALSNPQITPTHRVCVIFNFVCSFSVARRVEMVMHVMQMNDNRSWNETHVTVELETGASSGDLVKTRALLSCGQR